MATNKDDRRKDLQPAMECTNWKKGDGYTCYYGGRAKDCRGCFLYERKDADGHDVPTLCHE